MKWSYSWKFAIVISWDRRVLLRFQGVWGRVARWMLSSEGEKPSAVWSPVVRWSGPRAYSVEPSYGRTRQWLVLWKLGHIEGCEIVFWSRQEEAVAEIGRVWESKIRGVRVYYVKSSQTSWTRPPELGQVVTQKNLQRSSTLRPTRYPVSVRFHSTHTRNDRSPRNHPIWVAWIVRCEYPESTMSGTSLWGVAGHGHFQTKCW